MGGMERKIRTSKIGEEAWRGSRKGSEERVIGGGVRVGVGEREKWGRVWEGGGKDERMKGRSREGGRVGTRLGERYKEW